MKFFADNSDAKQSSVKVEKPSFPYTNAICRVVESSVSYSATGKTKYHKYTLEDLSTNLSPKAKKIFKITDNGGVHLVQATEEQKALLSR